MTHLLALALCLSGFAALALAMPRQQREIVGRLLPPGARYALRGTGAAALVLALGLLVGRQGLGLGLVMFSGHTSLAAGIVYCALIGYGRYALLARPSRRAG